MIYALHLNKADIKKRNGQKVFTGTLKRAYKWQSASETVPNIISHEENEN
jgi:hypothetical protein